MARWSAAGADSEEVDSDEDQSSDEASAVALNDQAAAQEQPAEGVESSISTQLFGGTLHQARCSWWAQPGHQLLTASGLLRLA